MSKKYRHRAIREILQEGKAGTQETLLKTLKSKGFELTQATLSRDIKELKIVKVPTSKGNYTYQLSDMMPAMEEEPAPVSAFGFVSIEFSGQLAVMKTRPGYAMAIAAEIDRNASRYILGTVAGDDTILLIPRESVSREEIIASLSAFIPNVN